MIKAITLFVLTAAALLAVFVFGLGNNADTAVLIGSSLILLLTILAFLYITSALDKRPAIIIRRYMGSMTIKLLLSAGLLAWYMTSEFKDKGTAVFLVVLYFVLLTMNGLLSMKLVRGQWGDPEE